MHDLITPSLLQDEEFCRMLRRLSGDRSARNLVVFLALLADGRLEGKQVYSPVTPEQVAELTGLSPWDVDFALLSLSRSGRIELLEEPGGALCYRINL